MTNAGSIVGKIMSSKKPSVEKILGKSYNKKHYTHEGKEGLLHEEEESYDYEKREYSSKHQHHKG